MGIGRVADFDVVTTGLSVAELAGFRAGDPDGVRAVVQSYSGVVFAVANRVLRDQGLAEEAAQQTFLQAWRHGATFDTDRELAPWLATIARRAAIDIQRRERRRGADSLDAPRYATDTQGSGPGRHDGDSALTELPPSMDALWQAWQVRQAIDQLDPREAELVRLHYHGGLTHSEIAERLDLAVGTVKSRLFRAHRQLLLSLRHLREDAS
jgi:RNA polymerase sigma factor (sigma-70 family)